MTSDETNEEYCEKHPLIPKRYCSGCQPAASNTGKECPFDEMCPNREEFRKLKSQLAAEKQKNAELNKKYADIDIWSYDRFANMVAELESSLEGMKKRNEELLMVQETLGKTIVYLQGKLNTAEDKLEAVTKEKERLVSEYREYILKERPLLITREELKEVLHVLSFETEYGKEQVEQLLKERDELATKCNQLESKCLEMSNQCLAAEEKAGPAINILERMTERMRLINGSNQHCIDNPLSCENHTIIELAQRIIEERKGKGEAG